MVKTNAGTWDLGKVSQLNLGLEQLSCLGSSIELCQQLQYLTLSHNLLTSVKGQRYVSDGGSELLLSNKESKNLMSFAE